MLIQYDMCITWYNRDLALVDLFWQVKNMTYY
jgi:hypothetical protein